MAEDPVRQQAQGLRARVGAGTHGVSKLWSRGGVGLRASSRSTQTPHHGGRTVKTSVGRLLTGVVALALLLGGFGLLQDTAQAQDVPTGKTISGSGGTIYICTDRDCDVYSATNTTGTDNLFGVAFVGGGTTKIQNLDLPRVVHKTEATRDAVDDEDDTNNIDGPDANPKTLEANTATIVGVHESSGLTDTDELVEVKAFHGNRIQVTYTPPAAEGAFATIRTVVVDNVKPQLVADSPSVPLIVTSGVDLVFSADVTDGTSGYNTDIESDAAVHLQEGTEGVLNDARNNTLRGAIRLVVAGNNVSLGKGAFTAIDNGWRVSKTVNSSAIQSIGANIPWYFETRDRAGNVTRTSGSISSTGTSVDTSTASGGTTLRDAKFQGSLNGTTFSASKIRVTRKDANGNPVLSNVQDIELFAASSTHGQFTFLNTAANPLFGKTEGRNDDDQLVTPYRCPFDAKDIAADPDNDIEADNGGAADPTNAVVDAEGNITTNAQNQDDAQLSLCAALEAVEDDDGMISYKSSSYEILGSNLITVDSEAPTLADAAVVTGVGYNSGTKSIKVQKNSIQMRFVDPSDADGSTKTGIGSGVDASSVVPGAFTVSGHTVESVIVAGNTVYLTLADNLGSTERPAVSISSGVVMDKAGNAFGGKRVSKAVDGLGPNLSLSRNADLSNDKITVTITTDEQLNAIPTVTIGEASNKDGDLTNSREVLDTAVTQAGALSYTYTHSDSIGGEFSVHASGADTGMNSSSVGDKKSSSSSKAFTFELDKRLNNGNAPSVMVADKMGVGAGETLEDVEQTSPLNITVDFSQEGKEYDRDSYGTVTLTSAKLKVTASDGTSETTTFDIATDVNTPDSRKFTISLLNPSVGTYQLTVQAMDSAGNVRTDSTGTTAENLVSNWSVVPAKPFSVALAVGWNQISLPFHPANTAINSVIPEDHPITTVLTYDNAEKIWLFSTRNAETGLFDGDVRTMTADTAYFVLTTNFTPLKLLRPPLTSGLAGPPVPLAIGVVQGWNLVPVITNSTAGQVGVGADDYFGSLATGTTAGWLRALTFNTTSQGWDSVTPGQSRSLPYGAVNPCTGKTLDPERVENGTEPCQVGVYTDLSKVDNDRDAVEEDDVDTTEIDETEAFYGPDGKLGDFDANDRVVIQEPVLVGKGYWIYVTVEEGAITPR